MAYNDWVAQGSPCGSAGAAQPAGGGTTAVQQMEMQGAQQLGTAVGAMIGQEIGQALFGSPQKRAELAAERQAQQQRALAAQQLNNSGIYLFKQKNYAGAVNEFQQALALTPGDLTIASNLATAKQRIKDTAVAERNRAVLGELLDSPPNTPSDAAFDQLTHTSIPSPNSSALSLVNLDSDAGVVNLSEATKTSVDPATLKGQMDNVLTYRAPVAAPPDPRVQLPQDKDVELLTPPPQPTPSQWPGPQRPAGDPKLVNPIDEEERKAELGRQMDAIFAQPGGLDDILEKGATGAVSR
jgi:hypothetical protein